MDRDRTIFSEDYAQLQELLENSKAKNIFLNYDQLT
jgi:hypothetical protein